VATDVVLRSVGVQRDFGSVEHHQQLGLVGVEPHEQSIERDEAGFALEDAVEPRPQGSVALFGRGATIRLEITIEGPDQVTHGGLDGALAGETGLEILEFRKIGVGKRQPWCASFICAPIERGVSRRVFETGKHSVVIIN
jgi:hypothetical protein